MQRIRVWSVAAAAAVSCLGGGVGFADAPAAGVEEEIPKYEAAKGVSGNLSSVGSDTLLELMTLWSAGFKNVYSNVNFAIEGKGSATAPPALIAGTSHFGPMSREMKPDEIAAFEKQFGYKPTGVAVALDALAIYVGKDNPIEKLTLQQADAIFSSTRKGGAPGDVTTWGQLGLTGEWASLPISLYGRNSASGTYTYFKEHVLSKGDYKATVKEMPGSAAVVDAITTDRGGIGYSGVGYRTSGVRAVPIVAKDGTPYEAVPANVYNGKYPISRALFVYVNKAPGQPLPPAIHEFLDYVLSREGQEIVVKGGFVALTRKMVTDYRAKVN